MAVLPQWFSGHTYKHIVARTHSKSQCINILDIFPGVPGVQKVLPDVFATAVTLEIQVPLTLQWPSPTLAFLRDGPSIRPSPSHRHPAVRQLRLFARASGN